MNAIIIEYAIPSKRYPFIASRITKVDTFFAAASCAIKNITTMIKKIIFKNVDMKNKYSNSIKYEAHSVNITKTAYGKNSL